jgi:hypothetical protein
MRNIILATSLFTALPVVAEDCDCQHVVGQCTGAIDFVKAYGSAPSYGAEIVIHSSERICSKVEYYVDGTPHQTVLVNKSQEPESLFGSRPITQKSVTFRACYVCDRKKSESKPSQGGESASAEIDEFSGHWSGSGRNSLGFRQDLEIEISKSGPNRYQLTEEKKTAFDTFHESGQGTAQGKTLTYNLGGASCTLDLSSATNAIKRCRGWGTSNEIQLERR